MKKILLTTLGLGALGVAQAQAVIKMTAPTGTQLTGTIQSTTSISGFTVEVQPKPNVRLTAEALANYRKTFGDAPGALPATTQTLSATLDVLEARADGSVPVQTSIQIPMGEGKDPLNFVARTLYAPDGKISMEIDEVSDPAFQKVLSGMKDLLNSPETQAIYTRPWTPGAPFNQNVTLPFEQFTGDLPYRLVGDFNMTTTTTYVQRGPGESYIFQIGGTSGLTEIRALDDQDRIVMKIFMDKVNVSGETRIRKDGLPSSQRIQQSMKMTLIMNMPDLPVFVKTSMNLSVQQTINWSAVQACTITC